MPIVIAMGIFICNIASQLGAPKVTPPAPQLTSIVSNIKGVLVFG